MSKTKIQRVIGLFLLASAAMLGGAPGLANAQITTTTALSLTSANSVTGDVRLDFRVSGCAPDAVPYESGTIQIFDGATPVYSSALNPPGLASGASSDGPCTGGAILSNGPPPTAFVIVPTLPAVSSGTHTYTAVYSGDPFYSPSTSSAITVTIPPRPASVATVTALSLTSANSVTGDVRLGFRVSGCAPDGVPYESGAIQIFEGATAVYSFTLGSTPNPFGGGPTSDGPCDGGSILSNGPPGFTIVASPTLPAVSPGTHTYTAGYSGDAFYGPSTSPAIVVVIPPRSASVATSTALSLAGTNSVTGDVRLNFRVSGCAPDGEPYESGTIQVFDGATSVYSSTLSSPGSPSSGASSDGPCTGGTILSNGPPPTAFLVTPTLPAVSPGTHTYTATYSGDAFYSSSTSSPIDVSVTALPAVPPGQSFGGPTATHTGNATLRMSGGGALCGFTRAAFLPVDGNPLSPPRNSAPPGLRFPHGLIAFATSGCTPGATLTFTLTLPDASAAAGTYMKYGPTPDRPAPHWYRIPASIQGNIVTFSITDGALGDDDLTANGTVVDAGGLAISDPIPTLSEWMILVLMLLLAFTGAYEIACHRR